MTENLILFFCYVIENIFLSILIFGFCGSISRPQLYRVLIVMLPFSLLQTFFEQLMGDDPGMFYINIILVYLYILLCFGISVSQSALMAILSHTVCMLLQIPLVILVSRISLPEFIPIPIFGNLCTLAVIILLVLTGVLQKAYAFIISRSLPVLICFTNLAGISLMLNVYNKAHPSQYSEMLSTIFLPLSIIICLNIVIFYDYSKQQREKERLAAYDLYLPVIEEMIDQIRQRQHKYDNTLQTFFGLPGIYDDYDSLTDAIRNYYDDTREKTADIQLLKLNKKFLAAFIYQKLTQARKMNISVVLDLPVAVIESRLSEQLIIEITGILFDNMLEATPSSGTCRLTICSEDGKYVVSTQNPANDVSLGNQNKMFAKGYTTKKTDGSKRGYGLFRLKSISDKLGGKICIDNPTEDGIRQIKITVKI